MSRRSRRLIAASKRVPAGGRRPVTVGDRARRRILVVVVALGALALCAGPASAAPLRWSSPRKVDFTGGIALGAITCPAQDQCDALDAVGRLEQFNPEQFEPNPELDDFDTDTVTLDPPAPLVTMSCPKGSCTVVDEDGSETTFGLGDLYGTLHYARVDRAVSATSSAHPTGLACPSRTRCVLVDGAGGVVSFSPADPSAATRTVLARGQTGGLVAVTCPTTAQCTAISQTQEWTFAPTDPAAATTATIDATPGAATALTCPSTTQCTAVDGSGRETTFDPQTPAAVTPVVVSSAAHADFTAVICPTTSLCTGADDDGYLESFAPQTGTLISRFADEGVNDFICLSSSLCLADGNAGYVAPFIPGSSQPASSQPGSAGFGADLDGGSPVVGVACPSTTRCFGADATGALVFDPYPGYKGGGEYRLPGSGPITGLACARLTLCSAVRGDEQVSFDPGHIDHLHPQVADHDGDATFTAVRCPGATECVAVDSDGAAVTYDPADGRIARSGIAVEPGRTLTALACPADSQCTATDDDGTALSFDPLTGRRLLRVKVDPRVGLDISTDAFGHELDGIACLSTASCVAVDTLGDVVSFDPGSRHRIAVRRVDTVSGLTAVACPSTGLCVLTGGDGRVFTGSPSGSQWTATRPFQAVGLTAIACARATECVAVDVAGEEFTSRPS